uniref:Asparagine--tRNA ligase n=1 Tax=uncultured bacterium contig00038 TaxID=1181526 RepID=A0A806KK90_9BACT|nr:asparaginyl-tRNA synthetase [uncultured bacterium contig00038]
MIQSFVDASKLKNHVGENIRLRGWVRNARTSKTRFVELRDGSGFVQCVITESDADAESYQLAGNLTQESVIELSGLVQTHPKTGAPEILVKTLSLIAESINYPITPKEHGTAFLMEHRHLWLRSKRQWAILRIRHCIAKSIRDFFDGDGFTLIDSPILTPSACEGTSTLFGTPYFDEGMAYLSQSGQLYLEPAIAAFGKVYCFGPTFRAEKSKTRRHLTEFWMVEPEVAFAHLEDIMALGERMMKFIIGQVLEFRGEELKILERDLTPLENALNNDYMKMTYTESVERLKELGSDIQWGEDYGNDDETILMNSLDRPCWVHRFPKSFKAFYMEPDPTDPKLALGADLLAPEGYGEIIGGGERASSLQYLLDQIEKEGLDEKDYKWYLDVRRYGSVPHAGFGLGLERAVAWICKLPHVRETGAYPRMMGTLWP